MIFLVNSTSLSLEVDLITDIFHFELTLFHQTEK